MHKNPTIALILPRIILSRRNHCSETTEKQSTFLQKARNATKDPATSVLPYISVIIVSFLLDTIDEANKSDKTLEISLQFHLRSVTFS